MEEELKINIIPTAAANSESMGQWDVLNEIVAKFKANGNRKMSNSEMKVLLHLFPVSTEEEVDRVVTEMDGDGDGVIHFDQFIGFVHKEEIHYASKSGHGHLPYSLTSAGFSKKEVFFRSAFEWWYTDKANPPSLAPGVTVPGTHEVNNLPPPRIPSLMCSGFLNEEGFCLPKAFGRFDTDGYGKISAMGVKSVLSPLGSVISPEEAQRITAKIDKDGDGLVDLKELAGFLRKEVRIDVDGSSVFDLTPEANALTDNYEKWIKITEILLPITASGAYATASILSKATSAAGFIACVMVMLLRGIRWEAKAAAKVLAKFAAVACVAAVLMSLANDLPWDYAWIVVVLAFAIPLGAVSFA